MKKLSIEDLCISAILSENENVLYKPSSVEKILDFNFSKEDDFIKIKFLTSYGKKYDIIATFSDFKKWLSKNKKESKQMFLDFIKDFTKGKFDKAEDLEEIIDTDGNIIDDNDMPTNATNRLVVSPKFDIEKIYKSSIPKRMRYFSGAYGPGFIVW